MTLSYLRCGRIVTITLVTNKMDKKHVLANPELYMLERRT